MEIVTNRIKKAIKYINLNGGFKIVRSEKYHDHLLNNVFFAHNYYYFEASYLEAVHDIYDDLIDRFDEIPYIRYIKIIDIAKFMFFREISIEYIKSLLNKESHEKVLHELIITASNNTYDNLDDDDIILNLLDKFGMMKEEDEYGYRKVKKLNKHHYERINEALDKIVL